MKKPCLLTIAWFCIGICYGQTQNALVKAKKNEVVFYDSTKAQPGINLVDVGAKDCFFLTMKGQTQDLHLRLVNVLPDGNLIGCADSLLVKFDPDMNIIWTVPAYQVHHEITSDEKGNIYLLSSDFHEFMGITAKFDVVKIYSPEGALIFKWCTYDHLEEFVSVISKSLWLKNLPAPYAQCKNATEYILQYPFWFFSVFSFSLSNQNQDLLLQSFFPLEFSHFNSIQVLPDNKVSKSIPAFKKGNLLVSFDPYSCYGILNPSTGKIEWAGYLPERTTLHTPLLTPRGTILIFQNSTDQSLWPQIQNTDDSMPHMAIMPKQTLKQNPTAPARPWASVTEYNPVTNKKIWEYTAQPKETMNPENLGSAQRLPNGNTLICVSLQGKGGRVFEITPKKKVVWDYVSNADDLYRAKRVSLKMQLNTN